MRLFEWFLNSVASLKRRWNSEKREVFQKCKVLKWPWMSFKLREKLLPFHNCCYCWRRVYRRQKPLNDGFGVVFIQFPTTMPSSPKKLNQVLWLGRTFSKLKLKVLFMLILFQFSLLNHKTTWYTNQAILGSKNNTFREGGLENKTTWKNKLLKILHPTFSEMDSSD